MFRFLSVPLLFSAMVGPAQAADLNAVSRPCRVEILDIARAHCLDHLADQRELAIEGLIGKALSDLQGLRAADLIRFDRELRDSQGAWSDGVRASCEADHGDDLPGRALCRLAAALERSAKVKELLNEARDRLGAAPLPDLDPQQVETFVPLPDPPAGPDVDSRLPVVIPFD
ncbi:MAG: hypothetical protein AAF666_02020 [Pseudomonadota bacterium]